MRDLLEASKQFATLSSVVEFDLRNKTVKSPGSHTRNLRRVRQGLDLIKELFQNFISDEYANCYAFILYPTQLIINKLYI